MNGERKVAATLRDQALARQKAEEQAAADAWGPGVGPCELAEGEEDFLLESGEEDYDSDYSDFDDYYYDDSRRARRRKKKQPQFSLAAAAEASNGQRVSADVLLKYDYALVLTCDRSCMLAAVISASWQKSWASMHRTAS